jgi:ubiquinone/menaquinone biosynthesis C-methylase UbiE
MNERIYNQEVDKLRSEERIKRLEIEKVVDLCIQDKIIKTILDIGTGTGLFAEAFNKNSIIVSGIDINEKLMDSAKLFLPESEFRLAPAENIPYGNNSFDATFFGLVFHEVSDYKKSLEEAYRVSLYQTFILEWKYITEDFGPPIEHRLKEEFIKEIAFSVGYKSIENFLLTNLILYKIKK